MVTLGGGIEPQNPHSIVARQNILTKRPLHREAQIGGADGKDQGALRQ